jgi:hypothetical protein
MAQGRYIQIVVDAVVHVVVHVIVAPSCCQYQISRRGGRRTILFYTRVGICSHLGDAISMPAVPYLFLLVADTRRRRVSDVKMAG